MKKIVQIFVVGGALASAMMFSVNDAAALCWSTYAPGPRCQVLCDEATKWPADFIDALWTTPCKRGDAKCAPGKATNETGKQCCPIGTPTTFTSCNAIPDPNRTNWCAVTVCGPITGSRKAGRIPNLDKSRYATPKPKVGPPQPGVQ